MPWVVKLQKTCVHAVPHTTILTYALPQTAPPSVQTALVSQLLAIELQIETALSLCPKTKSYANKTWNTSTNSSLLMNLTPRDFSQSQVQILTPHLLNPGTNSCNLTQAMQDSNSSKNGLITTKTPPPPGPTPIVHQKPAPTHRWTATGP